MAEWLGLIASTCVPIETRPLDVWDMPALHAEFSRLLASGLDESGAFLEQTNRLLSVLDVMLAVLYGTKEVDAWLAREIRKEDADGRKVGERLFDILWDRAWKQLGPALEGAGLAPADVQLFGKSIGSSLQSRVVQAGIAAAKRRK